MALRFGAIAQMGERLLCTQEVGSSILPGSTNWCVPAPRRAKAFKALSRVLSASHLAKFLAHDVRIVAGPLGRRSYKEISNDVIGSG